MHFCGGLELIQEPQVVFVEQADVGDAVFAHSEAFDAEAEGPAGVFFAVDADGVEDVGVNHAAAAHLDPAFFAGFVGQKQIDLGAWFGEGEEAGAEPPFGVAAEEGWMNWSMVVFISTIVTPSSTTRASSWWNMNMCVASTVSGR